MATIIERAKEYADKRGFYGLRHYAAARDYKNGATEQKRIDIEKACELIMDELRNPKADTFQEFVDNFRKAMEE